MQSTKGGKQDAVMLFGGGEGLAPLRLAHLAPEEPLPFHIFTANEGVPGEFVLTWRRGQALPKQAREMVWGYFAASEAGQVLRHLLSRWEVVAAGRDSPPLKLLADALLVFTQHFFSHEAARTPESLAEARSLIAALGRGFEGLTNPLQTLSTLRRHDSGLFSHCLNVCLLTLAFVLSLGCEEAERQTVVLTALLHDLGMMPWAQETYHQTTPLSDQDWEEIKAHPDLGADLLIPLGEFPDGLLTTIRQHHENADGSGYPRGLKGDDIHPWARILRILDSYEALTSLRPWRPPVGERQALRLMSTAWSTQGGYDPEYLERFVAFCRGKEGR
ncbi:MAG: HD-GYP domain-containing protein [Desulfobaccales bacterium]